MTEVHLSDFEIVQLDPIPAVSVRVRRSFGDLDLAALFDAYLPLVFRQPGAVGPPYARYFEFGPETADVEIGTPVSESVDLEAVTTVPEGDLGSSGLPAARVAKVLHRGAYSTLSAGYDRLHQWIVDQGLEPGEGPWESYIRDPSSTDDPDELRTEIFWPLGSTQTPGQ